ncbi:hypothetical protein DPMN_023057 [Dreissena polymorpha]|uniref:Uncharacterized protein n=1 Tax=Dreissena polymorpha TaxID=45954 RepID=A0A9D4LLJ6_DREPO|nr:hypothetical protein DPMN_023057 [Dreissena polymorpha]
MAFNNGQLTTQANWLINIRHTLAFTNGQMTTQANWLINIRHTLAFTNGQMTTQAKRLINIRHTLAFTNGQMTNRIMHQSLARRSHYIHLCVGLRTDYCYESVSFMS